MLGSVERQRFQESDEEDNFLKIHYYQESTKFFEVPIYDNGTVSFTDITLMDSKIFALILQKEDGYRRLIKPKNGNWKEPKEKWDFFKVYAALKQQPEIEHNCNTLNENLNSTAKSAFNLNKNIKTEIPAVPVLILPQKNVEPLQRNTLSSLSNSDNCINNNKIKTETSTVLATIQQKIPESHHSSEPATDDGESLTEIEVFVTDDNGSTDCDDSVPQDNRFASRRISMDLPTDAQLFSVYKVSSLEELLYLLCRGDFKYHNVFIIAFYRFKRTMFTYPNNEIVRLIYCAIRSGTLLETLNLNTEGYCKLCRKMKMKKPSLKHLLSKSHSKMHRDKYNADPPEIAKLLEPKIYKQFIDPSFLASLKIPEFKKIEESPEFSIKDSPQKEELTKLKCILINRILQENLEISYESTFSIEKLIFLRDHSIEEISLKSFKKNDATSQIE